MLQRLRHAVGWGLTAPPPGTRVDFQVCAPLGHGQTVYLVGDIPALGGSIDCVPHPASGNASSIECGLQLVTTPNMYPIWYNLEPVVVPVGTVIRYRYAVCSGSKFVRYETLEVAAREVVVGMEEIQTRDTMDSLKSPSGEEAETASNAHEAFWSVVPRLSSGQAFVDRRANGSDQETSHGGRAKRGSTHRRSTQPIAESIPEESNESATPMDEAPSMPSFTQRSSSTASEPGPLGTKGSGLNGLNAVQSHRELTRGRSFSEDTSKSPQNVTIESTDGVIIVVYRLPVLVKRTGDGKYHIEWEDDNLVCPSGLLKESSNNPNWDRVSSMRLTWVGTVHCASPIPKEDEDRLARQLEAFHCVPVFLNPSLAETFHGFCYGTLWPIFHNIVDVYGRLPTRWWNPNQQKNAWASYKNANRIFVNKVIEVYNEGDLVWVHDLHLLVAPSFLSRRLPCVNVGLFLHTPFPSSEIFRTLSVRADLLRGMLSADHIGFHLYEHARHFLTSCRRILGLKYSAQPGGYIGIEYSGRMVMVTISHIGIEPPFMDVVNATPHVIQDAMHLVEKFEATKRTVIVGVDKVERLKGILLKLGAIEYFLSTHPEYVDKIQVVQVGIVDSSHPSEEKKCVQSEIANKVQRINERFGGGRKEPIVVYSEVENTDLASRLPLWKLGDILMTTSVRDAVNLYPFEFVYAHELSKKAGVVIVSEFSGSSRVLTGSIGVNPWKRDEIVSAMELALTMPESERMARHEKDLEYITNNSRTKWAERILIDLKRTKKASTEGEYMGYGLGLGFRMLEFNAGFKLLETETVARAYRNSFRRVLLFDYGNTLVQETRGTNDFSKYLGEFACLDGTVKPAVETSLPPQELLSALRLLCSDPRNTVFVLSGKDRADLEKLLGSVRGLGLAAEHGYLYKWGDLKGANDGEDVWLCTKDNFDDSWKDVTHSVMDIYTQRTHGTYVELKGSALLWQYRDADPEFGQLQAKELHDQLTQVLEHFPVEVLTGTDYLEVRPEGVDKGVIVDRIMSTLENVSGAHVDFVLCVGDDLSDEFMFQYLEERQSRPKMFTVTVGKKPSAAKYFVNDVDQVNEILNSLSKVSTAANRNLSMNDLRLLDNRSTTADWMIPSSRTSTHSAYFSEGSGDNDLNPSFSSIGSSLSLVDSGRENGSNSLRAAKLSMSMSALPNVANSFPSTSATYEQYFDNIDESEEDQGGIFF